ncbi:helix-turn-helix transcriptional regulator [Amycolatopsis marina]|nr:YafY family protein [Amycolatopsis marina]
MTDTASRLLSLLALLQTPREWPGSELAERMRVSPRTIRRDVDRLRELGYPVAASLGVTGGYRLVAGKAMPPLVLDDEEAVAIAVGLRNAAGHAVHGIEEASVRALTKLEQVLPPRLRRRVATLNAATFPAPPGEGPKVDAVTLTVLAGTVANGERLRFTYRSSEGAESKRLVDPHRLVPLQRRWYLVAFDHVRDDWRIFRVDRITAPLATGARATPRELPAADAAEFVTSKLYSLAPTYRAVATLHLPLADALGRIGDGLADLEPIDEHRCLLRSHSDTLEWVAFRLVLLGCEFEVHEPPELAEYLRALGARVLRASAAPD